MLIFTCLIADSTDERRCRRLRPNDSVGMLPSRACCSIQATGTCSMSANCCESSRRSVRVFCGLRR